MKILVLAMNEYNFENDNKEKIEGINLEYLSESIQDSSRVGFFPLKQSIDKDLINKINKIPGIYNVDIKMVSGKNRKATPQFVDLTFVKDFEIKI